MPYKPCLTSTSIEFLAESRIEDDTLYMELQRAASADDYINSLIEHMAITADLASAPRAIVSEYPRQPAPAPPKNPPRKAFIYGRAGKRA